MISQLDSGPNLLLDWSESRDRSGYLRAGIGSLLVHAVVIALAFFAESLWISPSQNATAITADFRRVTPLYDPPVQLTQKAPNQTKVAKEVDVEGLLAPPTPKPAPPARAFQPPPPKPLPGPPVAAPRLAEPPKIDASASAPAALPPAGTPKAPPPQIQSEEKPKLAFETPGQHGPSSSAAVAKLAPPKTTVDDAIHSVARGGGQGGVVVEDPLPPPNIPGTYRTTPSPAAHGQLELLSDPMGVDFKPYLIRILALVRQNWYSVIPESARLGNRGVVQLQFVISRDGQVPKLVIAMPSGSESLDRAAVAGISASVPFPPLPQEFKGREIRLQFAFKYNLR